MSESRLHEFNLLLTNATAAAKMAAQPWEVATTPAIEAWRERAKAWAARVEEVKGSVSVDLSWGWGQSRGWSYSRSTPQTDFATHPLAFIAQEVPHLAAAVESLPDEAIERAAQEVAKHLAVSFEREGVHFLAFPQQGTGLKVRARKGAAELSAWVSDWRDQARYALAQSNAFGNHEARYLRDAPAHPEMEPAVQALAQAYASAPYRALHDDSQFMTWGDLPTSGAHAAGRLPGSASSEEELPLVGSGAAKFSPGEITASAMATDKPSQAVGRYGHGAEPPTQSDAARLAAQRRLGWFAIAMLLGDKPTPAQAAAPWGAPACSAELALSLEAGQPCPRAHMTNWPARAPTATPARNRRLSPKNAWPAPPSAPCSGSRASRPSRRAPRADTTTAARSSPLTILARTSSNSSGLAPKPPPPRSTPKPSA